MEKDKQQFYFGIVSGIAVVSTLAFIGLLIYVVTGGNLNFGGKNSNAKVAGDFEQCLASNKYDSKISADQNLGLQLGVQGTPTSIINGYVVRGALPYEMIKQVIDDLLAGREPSEDFLKDKNSGEITKVDMPQITDTDHVIGATNGKITLVEFSDFECPYCGRFYSTVKQIEKDYANDVTIVFKNFPLSFHQYAKPAAVAAECAGEQGKFWEMHDKLFDLNVAQKLNTDNIKKAAEEIGLK